MVRDRLKDLEESLELLYEQLDAAEKAAITEQNKVAKQQYKQQIERELEPDICKFEQKYVRELNQQVKASAEIPEAEAEVVVAELVEEVTALQTQITQPEALAMLQQILAELQKLDKPASAKLEVSIPLIPGIAAVKVEGDGESIARRLFGPMKRLAITMQNHPGRHGIEAGKG